MIICRTGSQASTDLHSQYSTALVSKSVHLFSRQLYSWQCPPIILRQKEVGEIKIVWKSLGKSRTVLLSNTKADKNCCFIYCDGAKKNFNKYDWLEGCNFLWTSWDLKAWLSQYLLKYNWPAWLPDRALPAYLKLLLLWWQKLFLLTTNILYFQCANGHFFWLMISCLAARYYNHLNVQGLP